MAREKAAFLIRVFYKVKVGPADVREVEHHHHEGTFTIHLVDGRTCQGSGFEALWLLNAVRSPGGWAIPETLE